MVLHSTTTEETPTSLLLQYHKQTAKYVSHICYCTFHMGQIFLCEFPRSKVEDLFWFWNHCIPDEQLMAWHWSFGQILLDLMLLDMDDILVCNILHNLLDWMCWTSSYCWIYFGPLQIFRKVIKKPSVMKKVTCF